MKVTPSVIDDIAARMRKAAEYLNAVEAWRQAATVGHLWQMWHWIHNETAYTDDHPRFNGRNRLFPHDFNYPLYPCGTNDATMTTALKAAHKKAFNPNKTS